MSIKKMRIWKLFSSIKLAIWLLALIGGLSLVGTFIPQDQAHLVYARAPFILLVILFSINLTVCLLNRLSLNRRMLGSTLTHASILIILLGALIGALFGQKGLVKIGEAETISSFISKGGRHIDLGFSIRLDKFIYTEHIDPKEKLLVYALDQAEEKLIAEIPTEIDIESDIADTGYKIKVLRYIPDFAIDTVTKVASSRSARPNNPAIEVRTRDRAGKESTFWVFARFPDIHQKMGSNYKFVYHWVGRRPKDFISKVTILKGDKEVMSKDIRVNEPLRFGGYTFFQSTYDAEGLAWSGLEVVRDPGVWVVYLGFILLIVGLIIIFYINPLIQRR